MPDRRGHTAYLPVFSFDQFQSDPAIGNGFAPADRRIARWDLGLRFEHPRTAGERFSILNDNAPGKRLQRISRRDPFHLSPVNSSMSVARMKQLFVQTGFVAEQEQTFRIGVESSERINIFCETEFRQSAVARTVIGELRNDTERFVEGD